MPVSLLVGRKSREGSSEEPEEFYDVDEVTGSRDDLMAAAQFATTKVVDVKVPIMRRTELPVPRTEFKVCLFDCFHGRHTIRMSLCVSVRLASGIF